MVHFPATLRDSVNAIREGCGDVDRDVYTPGWVDVLKRYVLRAIRTNSPQASVLVSNVNDVFGQGKAKLEAGDDVPQVLGYIVGALARKPSGATASSVLQTLTNYTVEAGTPFSDYYSALRLLVNNVKYLGASVAPGDGIVQSAVETGIEDQYASIAMLVFGGRNHTALPYDSASELMWAIDNISGNGSPAIAAKILQAAAPPPQVRGRVHGRSGNNHGQNRSYNNVMTVGPTGNGKNNGAVTTLGDAAYDTLDYHDEDMEFLPAYEVLEHNDGYRKNNRTDPPFYEPFNSRDEKDRARRAFGHRCLNCGKENHFARTCSAGYITMSGIIHHAIGEGSEAEVNDMWRR